MLQSDSHVLPQAVRRPPILIAAASVAAWAGASWLSAPHLALLTLAVTILAGALLGALAVRARSSGKDAAIDVARCAAMAIVNLIAFAVPLACAFNDWFYVAVLTLSFAVALRLSLELAKERTTGTGVIALISSACGWIGRGLVISLIEKARRWGLAKAIWGRGRPRSPYQYELVERLLVVSHSYIGDAVMQTPAIALLAKALPGARIVVLTNDATDGVFRDSPFVHERIRCLPAHGKYPSLAEFRRLLRLRREGPTLCVLDFNGSQTLGIWFAAIARPRYLIADGSVAPDARFLADEIVTTSDLSHHVDRNAAVVCRSSLGVARGLRAVPELTPILAPDAAELPAAAEALRRMQIGESSPLIGFVVGSAAGRFATAKRWPVERFAALAQQLRANIPSVELLAFKGPQELDVNYGALEEAGCHIVEGKTLLEVAGLIERCDALVGNDSGLAHVGASMGTPIITIFGPTDWSLVRPYSRTSLAVRQEGCPPCFGGQELVRCRGERTCILGVTVEQVVNATLGLLTRASPIGAAPSAGTQA